ncbi:MAG: hypothetical protein U0872_01400 [Planctomycetaceae bacterium]
MALTDDNCIDVYTQDLGFLAIVENDKLIGYNVLVGGGMGVTPSAAKTFVALAEKMAFIAPEEVIAVAEAVVKVQRDFGNREDRKRARLKYLIHDWGVEKFKAKVEEYYGKPLAAPHAADVTASPDHIGWYEQGDGKLFLGINIETGRIKDEGDLRIKTGLRKILQKYDLPARLTALQSVILCDIDPKDKHEINGMLAEHGIKQDHELTMVRRLSIACPAFPTCMLSITESERVLPGVIDQLEVELARLGIPQEQVAVHMTGCPNGCARPYTPDIGFVGKTLNKYTIFLGGNVQGTRLAFNFKDMVPLEELVPSLVPVLNQFQAQRTNGESLGDFCARVGKEGLAVTEPAAG